MPFFYYWEKKQAEKRQRFAAFCTDKKRVSGYKNPIWYTVYSSISPLATWAELKINLS